MGTIKKFKIGLIQMAVPDDRSVALRKAQKMIGQAAAGGAKIVCLPELFDTKYFPQQDHQKKDLYAQSLRGEAIKSIGKLAKKLNIVLIAPFYEKDGRRYFNTAVAFDQNGRLLGKYRKVHLPHDPGFYEKSYFAPGTGYKVFQTKYGKIAVLICYDQWFPEAARAARLAGAEIIFYPTALGDIIGYKPEGDWHNAWETVQRGHAIANSVYVAAINRVGREGRMKFFGQSFVCDPFGKILRRAKKNGDETVVAEVDISKNNFFAEGWGFLRNRRPETYKILTSNKFVEKHKGLKDVPHYKNEIRALKGK